MNDAKWFCTAVLTVLMAFWLGCETGQTEAKDCIKLYRQQTTMVDSLALATKYLGCRPYLFITKP